MRWSWWLSWRSWPGASRCGWRGTGDWKGSVDSVSEFEEVRDERSLYDVATHPDGSAGSLERGDLRGGLDPVQRFPHRSGLYRDPTSQRFPGRLRAPVRSGGGLGGGDRKP